MGCPAIRQKCSTLDMQLGVLARSQAHGVLQLSDVTHEHFSLLHSPGVVSGALHFLTHLVQQVSSCRVLLSAFLLGPRLVTGLYHAGEPTYNAILSFSYVISAYNLIPGRLAQTNQIGSPACGGIALAYSSNQIGGEADAVDAGSPGGYASFRATSTLYYHPIGVLTALSAVTLAAHVRVRSGWTGADVMHMFVPAISGSQLNAILLAGQSSQIYCEVYSYDNGAIVAVTSPMVNVWHTYTCTFDTTSDILSAYMDGVLVGTAYTSATSSATEETSGYGGYMSLAPELDTNMDLKAAYAFTTKKDATEVAALHASMILDGTPCAFPS
jgi:hypothetical protein